MRALFEQGLQPRDVYWALRGKVSDPTVRSMYSKWQAEVAAKAAEASAPPDRAAAAAWSWLERPANELQPAASATAAAQHSAPAAADCAACELPAQQGTEEEQTGKRAEQAGQELSLEAAAEYSEGQLVQHAGAWLMLGMLQAMGLYAAAKKACPRAISEVALRLSLDAVAIALSIGQRCVEGVRRLATPSAALLLRATGAISASWTRRLLSKFAAAASAQWHLEMAHRHLQQTLRDDGRVEPIRSSPTWGLCPARTGPEVNGAWAPSPSKATATCARCWSKQPGPY